MIKALTEGNEVIDILAAGTAMRFLTAYLSSTPVSIPSPERNGCSNAPYRY